MKKYDQLPTIQKSAYLSTGELAKIMGISKHTLFYYDEIGLFCPAIKLDNEIGRASCRERVSSPV